MGAEPINAGIRAYKDSGATEDLATRMIVLYNPLYGTTKLSEREKNASREIDFRAVGFLYLFKGDKKKARLYLEIAHSMSNEVIRDNITMIFDKWEDVCKVVNSSKGMINRLRLKKRQLSLDKLLE